MPEEPWPYFAPLFIGWSTIGRDINGTSLHTERRSWLERNGWTDPGEEEAGMLLMAELEAEAAKIHNELYPPTKK